MKALYKKITRAQINSMAVEFLRKKHYCSVGSNDISFDFDSRYCGRSGRRMSYNRPDKRSVESYMVDVLNFYHEHGHHAATLTILQNIFAESGIEHNRNRITMAVTNLRNAGIVAPKNCCDIKNWYNSKVEFTDGNEATVNLEYYAYSSMLENVNWIIWALENKNPVTLSDLNDLKNHRAMAKHIRALIKDFDNVLIMAA